jgi:hypothetical protein
LDFSFCTGCGGVAVGTSDELSLVALFSARFFFLLGMGLGADCLFFGIEVGAEASVLSAATLRLASRMRGGSGASSSSAATRLESLTFCFFTLLGSGSGLSGFHLACSTSSAWRSFDFFFLTL